MDQLVLPLHPNRMLSPRLLEIRIYYPRESKSTNCPSNEPRPIIENSKFLVFLWLLIQRGRNPCFLLSRMHIQIRNHSLTRVGRDMLYGKYPIEIVCECCSARLQVVLPGSLFALLVPYPIWTICTLLVTYYVDRMRFILMWPKFPPPCPILASNFVMSSSCNVTNDSCIESKPRFYVNFDLLQGDWS